MHANFMSQDDRTISGSHTHTHTHTHPFNGPFSGTTWVGRYQKGKPIWILLKQESVSGSGISWAICKSAHRSRQITMPAPHHSVFYRPDALPAAQPTVSKHGRHKHSIAWITFGILSMSDSVGNNNPFSGPLLRTTRASRCGNYTTSLIDFFISYGPQHLPCIVAEPGSLFLQSHSKFSLA